MTRTFPSSTPWSEIEFWATGLGFNTVGIVPTIGDDGSVTQVCEARNQPLPRLSKLTGKRRAPQPPHLSHRS